MVAVLIENFISAYLYACMYTYIYIYIYVCVCVYNLKIVFILDESAFDLLLYTDS